MKEVIFLDFDGVIVDSIEECYIVSFDTYFRNDSFQFDNDEYRKLFDEYRNLVGPVHQFKSLHELIVQLITNDNIENHPIELFNKIDNNQSSESKTKYEKIFFETRRGYQQNKVQWLEMHKLTEFGKILQKKDDYSNYFIITTKDKGSVKALCDYYSININNIFCKDEFNLLGSKGKIISNFMNNSTYESAIFVDDSVKHLDSVNDDRVTTFFADWGYDINQNKYKIYDYL